MGNGLESSKIEMARTLEMYCEFFLRRAAQLRRQGGHFPVECESRMFDVGCELIHISGALANVAGEYTQADEEGGATRPIVDAVFEQGLRLFTK